MEMAARDNLNPDQLKMFMSPREVSHYVTGYGDMGVGDNPKTGLPHQDMAQLSERTARYKNDNITEGAMGSHIATEGVHKPVEIFHGSPSYGGDPLSDERVLWDGHHRTMAQSKANPDRLMPVVHRDQRETKEGRAYVMRATWRQKDDLPTSSSRVDS